jgi:acetyltransferase-like isoleucine patch superfamily enzyme
MRSSIAIRIITLPLGIFIKLWELVKEGTRDIHNQIRYKGAEIDTGCCINARSKIAENTHLFGNSIINNSKISPYTYIGKNCIIQNSNIGKFCSIANDVLIGLGKHPINNFSTSPIFYRINNPLNIKLVDTNSDFMEYQPVEIQNDVWIGARAIVLDGLKIGHGAVIAANSVVTKDVPCYAIVGGVPAKIIKYRFSDIQIEKLIQSEWWNWDILSIKQHIQELNNFHILNTRT